MYSKAVLVATLLAAVEARFGEEGKVQNIIQGLGQFGNPGQAATLAGQTPSVLLAGANACAKLVLADTIVTALGDDPLVIAGAKALVAAEKNFNPFAQSIPTICDDPALPATAALRGIVPLVDPAVTGSDTENANSAASIDNPFQANGLSVADIAIANGFSNLTRQGSDGATSNAGAGAGAGAGGNAGAGAGAGGNAGGNNNVACGAPVTLTRIVQAPAATPAAGNNNQNNQNNNAGGGNAGADFGRCNPTIDFVLGRPGRRADEGTFLPVDDLVAQGQQEALNPNIITNRVCDQLTNVCDANDAAKALCRQAQTLVQGLGTKDATTANAFNQALGF